MDKIRQCSVCGHKENLYTYFCTECGGKTIEAENMFTSIPTIPSTSAQILEAPSDEHVVESYSTSIGSDKWSVNQNRQICSSSSNLNNVTNAKSKKMLFVRLCCVAVVAIIAVIIAVATSNKRTVNVASQHNDYGWYDSAASGNDYYDSSADIEVSNDLNSEWHNPNVDDNEPSELHGGYADEELLEAARDYYILTYGYSPQYFEIDSYNGDEVLIHVYDIIDNHTFTYDWYTINIYTGMGSDLLDGSIDIMNSNRIEEESEYMLPGSDSRYLQMSDLEGMTADECRIARNELFARHGRLFNDEALQAYFNARSWYVGSVKPEDFDDGVFNEYEIANRDLIVQFEIEQGYR